MKFRLTRRQFIFGILPLFLPFVSNIGSSWTELKDNRCLFCGTSVPGTQYRIPKRVVQGVDIKGEVIAIYEYFDCNGAVCPNCNEGYSIVPAGQVGYNQRA